MVTILLVKHDRLETPSKGLPNTSIIRLSRTILKAKGLLLYTWMRAITTLQQPFQDGTPSPPTRAKQTKTIYRRPFSPLGELTRPGAARTPTHMAGRPPYKRSDPHGLQPWGGPTYNGPGPRAHRQWGRGEGDRIPTGPIPFLLPGARQAGRAGQPQPDLLEKSDLLEAGPKK